MGRAAWALPAAALGLYVAAFAVRARAIVETALLNPDSASAPVLASELARAPDGAVVTLGNFPWIESLAILVATRGLPEREVVWEAGPLLAAAVGMAAVAWATARAAGSWAGLICLTVLLAASPEAVDALSSWTLHGPTFVHAMVLAAFAVWVAAPGRRPAAASLGAVVAGLVTAPGLASDRLLLAAGILPLLAAGVAGGRRVLAPAGVAAVVAALGSLAVGALAREAGWRAAEFGIGAAGPGELAGNAVVLAKALLALGHGDVFGVAFGASTLVHGIAGAVAAAGLAAAAVAAWRVLGRPRGGADGAAPRTVAAARGARSAPLRAHAAFHAAAAVLLAGAFLVTDVAEDVFSARYLIGVLVAAAALAPLAVRSSRGRPAVAAGAALLAVTGVMGLARGEYTDDPQRLPGPADAAALRAVVEREDLGKGYASYFEAATLHRLTGGAARVLPVQECGDAHELCPFFLHTLSSWFVPEPGRSFVVVDTTLRQPQVSGLDPGLGPPDAVVAAGQLTVAVYPYDVARRLRPVAAPSTR
jgi:hypothetical protein